MTRIEQELKGRMGYGLSARLAGRPMEVSRWKLMSSDVVGVWGDAIAAGRFRGSIRRIGLMPELGLWSVNLQPRVSSNQTNNLVRVPVKNPHVTSRRNHRL